MHHKYGLEFMEVQTMFSSNFYTVPITKVNVDGWSCISSGTLSELANLISDGWYVTTRTMNAQWRSSSFLIENMPVLANDSLNVFIGIYDGNYGETNWVTINDNDGNYKTTEYPWGQPRDFFTVCIPNANNVIIMTGGYFPMIISKMRDNKALATKTLMTLSVHTGGSRPTYRTMKQFNLSDITKDVYFYGWTATQIKRMYTAKTLAREITTASLYSIDRVYESTDMYVAVQDLARLDYPQSILMDDTEYVGVNFNSNYSGEALDDQRMLNFYFKIPKEI